MNKTIEEMFDDRVAKIRNLLVTIWNNKQKLIQAQKNGEDFTKILSSVKIGQDTQEIIHMFLWDIIHYDNGNINKKDLLDEFVGDIET